MALLFLSDLVADQVRSDGRSPAVTASNPAVRRASWANRRVPVRPVPAGMLPRAPTPI